MYLRNYYRLVGAGNSAGFSDNDYITKNKSKTELKNIDGSTAYYAANVNSNLNYLSAAYGSNKICNNYSNATNGSYIVLGTGTTAVSYTDYKLSGSLITTVDGSLVYSACQYEELANAIYIKNVYNVTNTGSTSITIGEIGRVVNASVKNTGGSASASYYSNFLVERQVLAAPITIAAGKSAQLEYTMSIPLPV